jgi:hypothetical protein
MQQSPAEFAVCEQPVEALLRAPNGDDLPPIARQPAAVLEQRAKHECEARIETIDGPHDRLQRRRVRPAAHTELAEAVVSHDHGIAQPSFPHQVVGRAMHRADATVDPQPHLLIRRAHLDDLHIEPGLDEPTSLERAIQRRVRRAAEHGDPQGPPRHGSLHRLGKPRTAATHHGPSSNICIRRPLSPMRRRVALSEAQRHPRCRMSRRLASKGTDVVRMVSGSAR